MFGSGPEFDNEALFREALERTRRLLEDDAQLRAVMPRQDALAEMTRTCRYSIEYVAKACELYADRQAFGTRAYELVNDEVRYLPRFETITYAKLWNQIVRFATGIRRQELCATGDRVGICAFTSPGFVVSELACAYLGITSVLLETKPAPEQLVPMVNTSRLRSIVTSVENALAVIDVLPSCPSVRSVVIVGIREGSRRDAERLAESRKRLQAQGRDVPLFTAEELSSLADSASPAPMVLPREGTNPVMCIMFSSGSTGVPKGAMLPERSYVHKWLPDADPFPPLEIPAITIMFLPLNHRSATQVLARNIILGGLTYFTVFSDLSTLYDDIQLTRPTYLYFVPRVAELMTKQHQLEWGHRSQESSEARFGGRLLAAATAGAPPSQEVMDYLRRVCRIPYYNRLGSTETGILLADSGTINRFNVLDYQLKDVPELGYLRSDKPYPRGELLVKTRGQMSGYDGEAAKNIVGEDGYVYTSDIVEERAPDRVVLIGRKNLVVKLAQGEFINLAGLESDYASGSPIIQQILVYADSKRAYPLAVIVLDEQEVLSRFGRVPHTEALKVLLRGELGRIANDRGLSSFEIPRDFVIADEPFTKQNGLLTDVNKVSRPKIVAKYGTQLEKLYAEQENRAASLLGVTERVAADASTLDRVVVAVKTALGIEGEVDTEQSVGALGGDSLDATVVASLIERLCAVVVPVGIILSAARSLRDIAQHIDAAATGNRMLTVADVHGADSRSVRVSDVQLDKFLRRDELDAAARLASAATTPSVVLLTGATGFLGRFLALELVERLPPSGKVYCLVRAENDTAALARLRSSFDGDPRLTERFSRALAADRFVAIPGDLVFPKLGWSDSTFDRMASEVDSVLHNGALVNHALTYQVLFEPNVLGTAEVIRFALHKRLKAVSFVSTISLTEGRKRSGPVREDEDASSMYDERAMGGPGAGYLASKWVCELLLGQVHRTTGLPVDIFRCSDVMAHREYAGEINRTDYLTRLLCSLVYTGLAPGSFYEGDHAARHFDGLPVDFVAEMLADVFVAPHEGSAHYHLVNSNDDDGVSLDTFADWVRSYGYPLTRIEDHEDWYRRFIAALEALPGPYRQQAGLAIVQRWKRQLQPKRAPVDTTMTVERIRAIRQSADFSISSIDETAVHKALDDLNALKLIPPVKSAS
jgi:fatty acid CoA ligase FadD9